MPKRRAKRPASPPPAVRRERRAVPRYEARARVQLSWTDGRETRLTPGRLLNVSRLGAAIETPGPPPAARTVLLRLSAYVTIPAEEAEVVGIESTPEHGYRVRMKFLTPAPTVFLAAATAALG